MKRLTTLLRVLLLLGAFFAPARVGQAATRGPAAAGKNALAAERLRLLSADNRRAFPLLGNNFAVVSNSSARYNCIAHSLGIHNRWIDPQTGPAGKRLAPMDRLYAARGYHRAAGLDFGRRQGQQKVVVYAVRDASGKITRVTHAALQMPDGTWTSKLGQLPLIRHASPQALAGPEYGVPVAVYVR